MDHVGENMEGMHLSCPGVWKEKEALKNSGSCSTGDENKWITCKSHPVLQIGSSVIILKKTQQRLTHIHSHVHTHIHTDPYVHIGNFSWV